MDERYEKLIDILEKEMEVLKEFLDLLHMERQYMIDLSLDKLPHCTNKKETLILNLKVLEESRIDLINSMSTNRSSLSFLTLSKIIEEGPKKYKDKLKSCRSRLVNLVNSIKEINRINEILADRALSYARVSLNFLTRLACELPIYHSSGQIREEVNKGRILCEKG